MDLSTIFLEHLEEDYSLENIDKALTVAKNELIKQLEDFPYISEDLLMKIKDLYDVSKEFIVTNPDKNNASIIKRCPRYFLTKLLDF